MENRTTAPEVLEEAMSEIVRTNGKILEEHLGELVRSTVEETLNGLLDAEADHICGAERYERSPDRVDSRSGHYQRKLKTKAGEVKLKVPKLRKLPFESAIIERYRRRESSVEESLVEMYLAGISVRRVESITEALWGERVSPGTISNLNKKIYGRIEEWRNRPIEGEHPYVFLDGVWLKMSWGGEVQGVSVLVAIGVNTEGYRDVLGVCLGSREDEGSWTSFLRHLKERGLKGVRLVTSDKASTGRSRRELLFPEQPGSGASSTRTERAEGRSDEQSGRSRSNASGDLFAGVPRKRSREGGERSDPPQGYEAAKSRQNFLNRESERH